MLFILLAAMGTTNLFSSIRDDCPPRPAEHSAKSGSPFYCNRLALAPEVRKRHFDQQGPRLERRIKSVRELKDGYEFEFPGDAATYQLLTKWAIKERLCCPLFNIGLEMEAEGSSLWLRLTGRPGTKAFIRVDGAGWIKRP